MKANNRHGLYRIANEQLWMAVDELKNYLELLSYHDSYCFLSPLKAQEINVILHGKTYTNGFLFSNRIPFKS